MISRAVTYANRASSEQLLAPLKSCMENHNTASHNTLAVFLSSELPDLHRNSVWNIFETNMKDYYVQSPSFLWDPHAKKEELFDPLSRFILVLASDEETLLAYTMFRFDCEDGPDVVYCYELQVSVDAQKRGLGKLLLQCLSFMGQVWKMTSIVLTVQNCNTKALQFYAHHGFETDITSPNYKQSDVSEIETDQEEQEGLEEDENWVDEGGSESDEETVDYEILSRPIPPLAANDHIS